MLRQQNKLAPERTAEKAGNFLLNLAVAIGWLLKRITGLFTGKKRK